MLREKMSQLFSYALLFQMLITGTAIAAEKQKTQGQDSLSSFCENRLEALPGKYNKKAISQICSKVAKLESCHSVNGHPIFHYDSTSNFPTIGKKVLVLSVVHGDELEGGSVARRWNERLLDIDSRNTWRIIPILNPDGMDMKKRVNARGVDLNRNFPSNDWEELAIKYWKEKRTRIQGAIQDLLLAASQKQNARWRTWTTLNRILSFLSIRHMACSISMVQGSQYRNLKTSRGSA